MKKAFVVYYKDYEWVDYAHAETAQEAKKIFYSEWKQEGDYIDIRAIRRPKLDNLPLSGKNIATCGYGYEEDWLGVERCMCKCDLCNK